MGSLSSPPPLPTAAAPPPPTPVAAPPPPENTAESNGAQSTAEARRESLLRRNRGRSGTIQTSLRGLLGLSNTGSGRKTLLGE